MQEEIWKPIKGYEGCYEISSYGRIKSLSHKVRNTATSYRIVPETILKPEYNSPNGYLQVRLCVGGKRKVVALHRMVAEHFVPNPNNYKVVNHIDGDKNNNHKDNLEWCTQAHNQLHAIKSGLRKCRKVICVETGKIYPSEYFAAEEYECCNNAINACIRGNIKFIKGVHFNWLDNPIPEETRMQNYKKHVEYVTQWKKNKHMEQC